MSDYIFDNVFIDGEYTTSDPNYIIKSVKKEYIKTNEKHLDIAESVYEQIKRFLLKGLSNIQLQAINNSENEKTLKHKTFRNRVLDIIKNEELSEDYFKKFEQDNYGKYFFRMYNPDFKKPIFVRFLDVSPDGLARCGHATLGKENIPELNLMFIDNNYNTITLQTIKAFIDHKITVIHEMTHAIDGENSGWKIDDELEKPYNKQPNEKHAVIQEILEWIRQNFKDWAEVEEKIGEITPDNIRKFIDYFFNSDDQRNDEEYYSSKDYYRYALKNKYKKFPPKIQRQICAKVAEYLQFNKEMKYGFTESFRIPVCIVPWD